MSIGIQSHSSVPIGMQTRRRTVKPGSQRKTAIPEFGAFICQCPTTKNDIESGIDMDQRTFEKMEKLHARIYCPACRSTHVITIASGALAPIAQDHAVS